MALDFGPPKVRVKVELDLDQPVHDLLKETVEAFNNRSQGAKMTVDQAASKLLNEAVAKAAREPRTRRAKGAEPQSPPQPTRLYGANG